MHLTALTLDQHSLSVVRWAGSADLSLGGIRPQVIAALYVEKMCGDNRLPGHGELD